MCLNQVYSPQTWIGGETNKAARCWHLRQKSLIFQFLASASWVACSKPVQSLTKLDLYQKRKGTAVVSLKATLHRWRRGRAAVPPTNVSAIIKTRTPHKIWGREQELLNSDMLVIKGCFRKTNKLQGVDLRCRLNIVDIIHVIVMFLTCITWRLITQINGFNSDWGSRGRSWSGSRELNRESTLQPSSRLLFWCSSNDGQNLTCPSSCNVIY